MIGYIFIHREILIRLLGGYIQHLEYEMHKSLTVNVFRTQIS
jgi:hypothetical protein